MTSEKFINDNGIDPRTLLHALDRLERTDGWIFFIKVMEHDSELLMKSTYRKWEGDGITNIREDALRNGEQKRIQKIISFIEESKKIAEKMVKERTDDGRS